MFKKRVSLGTQALISSKDRKTLLRSLQTLFPAVTWSETLGEIEQIQVAKITGAKARLYYFREGEEMVPAFVDRTGKGEFFPTVFMMWRFPQAVSSIEVWSGVSSYILNGADLMWPGVCDPLAVARCFPQDSYLSIKVRGNPLPIAIGRVMDSGYGITSEKVAGRFIEVLHVYRDELWCEVDRTMHPVVPNVGFGFETVSGIDGVSEELDLGNREEFPDLQTAETTDIHPPESTEITQTQASTETPSLPILPDLEKKEEIPALESSGNDPVEEEKKEEGEPEIVPSAEELDLNIRLAFWTALKIGVRPEDVPLEPSKLQMTMSLSRPEKMMIDFKQSNYKKIGNFLKEMHRTGVIVYSRPKGSDHDQITSINFSHESLASFVPIVTKLRKLKSPDSDPIETSPFPKVKITHVLRPGKELKRFFATLGHADFDEIAVTREEAQMTLKTYIQTHGLEEGVSSKKMIKSDEILSAISVPGMSGETAKSDLYTRFLSLFKDAYLREDLTGLYPTELKDGPIPRMTLTLSRKQKGKKTTQIEGCEHYGIDPGDLLQRLQHLLATSGFLQPKIHDTANPPKVDVQIMGAKHKETIAELLSSYYKIPSGSIDVKDLIKPQVKR